MVLLNLTEENASQFNTMLGGAKPTVTLFYANWCGHCTAFKSEWMKISKDLARYKTFNVAQVEHSKYGLIPEHLRMNAFPTIQIIRLGRPMGSFVGTRNYDNVVKFALSSVGEKVLPPVRKNPIHKKAAPAPMKRKPKAGLKDKKKKAKHAA